MNYNKKQAIEAKIAELKPGMKRVNITFKVMNTSEERTVESQRDGATHRVVDAIVGDSTATVKMPLWNETIDSMEVGISYSLKDGYTSLFRGNLRLHVGKRGLIASADEPIEDVNETIDMSAKHYESSPRKF